MRQSCSVSFLRTAFFASAAASPFLVTIASAAAQVAPMPHDTVLAAIVPVSLHAGAPAYTVGADVATILAEEIRQSSAETLSELLEARVAGLSVLRESGTTANASRIQTRGIVSSIFATNPLIVVDGVPARLAQPSVAGGSNARTSRLDDIRIEEVERIDILRGPAAAALFGPGGAAGVIVITTNRSQGGPLRYHGRIDAGLLRNRTDFPANYAMSGINPVTGQPASRCSVSDQALQGCVADHLNQWSPLEQASRFRTGQELGTSGGVDGEIARTGIAIALGATSRRTTGLTPDDETTRSGLHTDFSRAIGRFATTSATLTYGRGHVTLPSDIIESGMLGTATNDANHGYQNAPGQSTDHGNIEHLGFSLRGTWQAKPWLMVSASGGRERAVSTEAWSQGTASYSAMDRQVSGNVGMSAAATSRLRGIDLLSIVSYDDQRARVLEASRSMSGSLLFAVESLFTRQPYRAVSLQERASFVDSLFINLGATWDATGVVRYARRTPFYQADAAWLVPSIGGWRGLRLRAAMGVAAADAALRPDETLAQAPPPFPPPRSLLDKERTRQTEFGLDVPLSGGSVSLTAFRSRTEHVFLPAVFAFPGPLTREVLLETNGSMRSAGVELSATSRLISVRSVKWDAAVSVSTVHDKVGTGFPQLYLHESLLEPGRPLHGVWGTSFSYRDVNGDGMIDTTEVTTNDTVRYVGASSPTVAASLHSDLHLGRWTLGATLDHRGGYKHINTLEFLRCSIAICRGQEDPQAPLEEQARASAAMKFRASGRGASPSLFLDDASFLRLREVALRWSGRAGDDGESRLLDRLGVALIAKDVALWTRYRGLDPEISDPSLTPGAELTEAPFPMRVLLRVELASPQLHSPR